MLTLADVFEALTTLHPDSVKVNISETAVDSRQVVPGGMFIALPGENADGHDYVADAFQRGASVALIQHEIPGNFHTISLVNDRSPDPLPRIEGPTCLLVENTLLALQKIARFWRSRFTLRVIGITGSVGKSTTKEVAAEVLSQRYKTLKNPGNMNNEIGLPLTILKLTPEHQEAVLEMGFYVPGEIALLCDIAKPQVGIITNIGTVHAERAGSQEAIFRGKSELVRALPEDGIAILNLDDPWACKMAEFSHARVFFYGLDPAAELWADGVESLGLEGIRFRFHYQKETINVQVPLIGQHSVQTALRAAAVGLVEGLNWNEIVNGLRLGQTQLRMALVRSGSGALLIDDTYNAAPESTLAALNLLAELEGRKVAVLGDMLELGPYEKQGHELVGVRAAQVADYLVTVGGRAHMIADSARQAGLKPSKIYECESTDAAILHLRKVITGKDVVLVKGSHGIHMEDIVSALEVAK
jgi:UDP-N-acetylmuramoyl-tripeptide--D-alanyl-D-alanine ligase